MPTRYGICLVLLCSGAFVACTEKDENVVLGHAAVRVAIVDTSLRHQRALLADKHIEITDSDLPAGGAQWIVSHLVVTVDGVSHDLAGGGECVFTDVESDTFAGGLFAAGACTGGFLVDTRTIADLSIEMTVAKAELLRAAPAAAPGCLPDPPPPDTNCDNDRIGEDPILDSEDACVWLPVLENSAGHAIDNDFDLDDSGAVTEVFDPIGDECQEESMMKALVTLDLPDLPAFAPPPSAISYLVVDLSSVRAVANLTWGPPTEAERGEFTIVPTGGRLCAAATIAAAALGCP